jgi:hypothetical protein
MTTRNASKTTHNGVYDVAGFRPTVTGRKWEWNAVLTADCCTCLFTALIYRYQRQCLSCDILRNVGATHTAVAVLLHIPVLYDEQQVGPNNLLDKRLHYLVTRGWTTKENIKWKKRSQSKLMTLQTHKHMEMKHGLWAGVYLVGGGSSAGPRGGKMGSKVNILNGNKLICALNKFLITQPNKWKFDWLWGFFPRSSWFL